MAWYRPPVTEVVRPQRPVKPKPDPTDLLAKVIAKPIIKPRILPQLIQKPKVKPIPKPKIIPRVIRKHAQTVPAAGTDVPFAESYLLLSDNTSFFLLADNTSFLILPHAA